MSTNNLDEEFDTYEFEDVLKPCYYTDDSIDETELAITDETCENLYSLPV